MAEFSIMHFPSARYAYHRLKMVLDNLSLRTSSDYWEQRYLNGGTSGAGSNGRLAEFKAQFLNSFVEEHKIVSVIEYGCGDGAQLKLALYPNYIGVDVSVTVLDKCRKLFSGDPSKQFFLTETVPPNVTGELALSLDVIFHLLEDSVFDTYMRRLFGVAQRFVIVYSSNVDQTLPAKHVRHRCFTDWIETNKPEWRLYTTLKNAFPYDEGNPEHTSFADFFVFARNLL
jgi:hypothetical protein